MGGKNSTNCKPTPQFIPAEFVTGQCRGSLREPTSCSRNGPEEIVVVACQHSLRATQLFPIDAFAGMRFTVVPPPLFLIALRP